MKLAKFQSTIACVGEEAGVKLEMTDGETCSDDAWCSEVETEEQCRGSCHRITGDTARSLIQQSEALTMM